MNAVKLLLGAITMAMADLSYDQNPELVTVKEDFDGSPKIGAEYQNRKPMVRPTRGQLFSWFWNRGEHKKAKALDSLRPAFAPLTPQEAMQRQGITWLGHASFLITHGETSLLVDPVWSYPFMKRYSPAPLRFHELQGVDYVLVTHGHFDHYDSETISKLSNTRALVPLQMGQRLIKEDNPEMNWQEAGWWQRYQTLVEDSIEVTFVPAQHWYKRSLWDDNKMLWGGFYVKIGGFSIYIAGDTSFDSTLFAEIREVMGVPDVILFPVGAYLPEVIMKTSHTNPNEAVEAWKILGAKAMIPCHWGTFDLSDELPGDPLRILLDLQTKEQLPGTLLLPAIGGTVVWDTIANQGS